MTYLPNARRLVVCLTLTACDTSPASLGPVPDECRFGRFSDETTAVTCLGLQAAISAADRDAALEAFATAKALEDSLVATPLPSNFDKAFDLVRALAQIGDFYSRELFSDSVRFHRMVDRVTIANANARGRVPYVGGRAVPPQAPYQVWIPYAGLGLFFQPVATAQLALYTLPRANLPSDSLLQIAQHLYAYALWRENGGTRFPVWEYEFDWTSGGVSVRGPWVSGLAEGMAMMVFIETYERTGDVRWRARAFETLNALRVAWDQGGVLLPDTTHGYWWEGFHPVVRPWNEGAEALVAVAYLYSVTHDATAKVMYTKGAAALKYYTPLYDTGSWTLYSLTQGYNGTFYHNLCIERLDGLYTLTADPWYKTVADRWRTYTPPPGIQ